MTSPGTDLREVRVVGIPVRLWAISQEQGDDLVRELTLIAIGDRDGERELPRRFTEVVHELTMNYGHIGASQEAELERARDAGEAEIDLTYEMPPEVGPVAVEIAELMDEVDEYCRQGQLLLSLASRPEIRAFRWWFLDEIRRQLEGEEPIAWADSHWALEVNGTGER